MTTATLIRTALFALANLEAHLIKRRSTKAANVRKAIKLLEGCK